MILYRFSTGAAQPWLRFFFLGLIIVAWGVVCPAQVSLVWQKGALQAENLPLSFTDSLSQDAIEPGQFLKLFRLDASRSLSPGQNAIWGSYQVHAESFAFYPKFKLRPGAWYRALWIYRADTLAYDFQLAPEANSLPPPVAALSPQLDTLPANLLKIYLHFSQPMAEGQAYQKVELLDENGKVLGLPFVPLQPELWDAPHQRLTLWLDPGRIKRGLGPNQASGSPLKTGKRYTFRVRADWKDQKGQLMGQPYEHTFWVGPVDRLSPQPKAWEIESPQSKSQEPLRIRLGERLDAALLQKCFQVYTAQGDEVPGSVIPVPSQDQWAFLPDRPWPPASYEIRIQAILEDLAGNNLNRLFDRDLQENPKPPQNQTHYSLYFVVK